MRRLVAESRVTFDMCDLQRQPLRASSGTRGAFAGWIIAPLEAVMETNTATTHAPSPITERIAHTARPDVDIENLGDQIAVR